MNTQKNFHPSQSHWLIILRAWLPNRGMVIFVFAILAILFVSNRVGAFPLIAPTATSTSVISYQGRLTNASNTPLTGNYNIGFRLYSASSGGSALWTEQWNNVQVSNGLFNVLLGSVTAIPQNVTTGNNTLWLGITVGSDSEMTPRVQLGSVPFATQALTVPDGSITSAKLNLNDDVKLYSGKRLWLRADQTTYSAGYFIHTELSQPNAPIRIVGTNDNATHRYVEFGHYTDETPTWQRKAFISTYDGSANFGSELDVSGNIKLSGGLRQILFSDPGNYDFSIVQNGGTSLDFRSPEYNGGTTALSVGNDGDVGIGTTSPSAKLHVIGDSIVTGSKSAAVQTASFGQRRLYAVEAPDVRFSDEGIATLQNGVARVSLDPIFLETIEGRYIVHVTPYGDATLFVDEIGADFFVVKARESNSNIEFAWRLSAVRKGYQGTRLERLGE